MVLLSTAQGMARAQWRSKGYDADGDNDTRTLAAFVARARACSLQIGLVVDEAHIGLDKGTEFGKFAHWHIGRQAWCESGTIRPFGGPGRGCAFGETPLV